VLPTFILMVRTRPP